jgi:hypothetical protein
MDAAVAKTYIPSGIIPYILLISGPFRERKGLSMGRFGGRGYLFRGGGDMFAAMLSRSEITASPSEDNLLKSLSEAMRARGFTLLGIVAMHEEEGSLVTFGDAETTQSAEFAGILRCLAEQIELNQEAPLGHENDLELAS